MSKDKTEKYDGVLSALHWVLSERLKHSRSWMDVSLDTRDPNDEHKYGSFEIRWESPRNRDPKYKDDFQSRVLPLNIRTLNAEVRRQMRKLIEEEDGQA